MSALREITQIIGLFRAIAHVIETASERDDLNDIRSAIQGLAEIGIDIGQYIEAHIDDERTQPAPVADDTHAGYEAARAWFADLDARVRAADGYYVQSGLPQAFQALPSAQHESFLAAVGSLMSGHLTDGDSIYDPQGFNFAESIALDEMTPEEQDAWSEKREQERRAANV